MFQSWKIHFQTVSRIFLAAPGSNELQLYESANPILSKSDPRIRKIPFITNRPTLSEAKRVMTKLLSVYEPEPEIDRLKVFLINFLSKQETIFANLNGQGSSSPVHREFLVQCRSVQLFNVVLMNLITTSYVYRCI